MGFFCLTFISFFPTLLSFSLKQMKKMDIIPFHWYLPRPWATSLQEAYNSFWHRTLSRFFIFYFKPFHEVKFCNTRSAYFPQLICLPQQNDAYCYKPSQVVWFQSSTGFKTPMYYTSAAFQDLLYKLQNHLPYSKHL